MEFSKDEQEQFWAKAFVAVATMALEKTGIDSAEGRTSALRMAVLAADEMLDFWGIRWHQE